MLSEMPIAWMSCESHRHYTSSDVGAGVQRRKQGVSFDNEHDYQMSLLKNLKDRRKPYKKRRMEMQSECEDFMRQTFEPNASKNMSRLMYDTNYKLPRDYDFSGHLYWQMFLESKAYRPDLLGIGEFKVDDNFDDDDDDDDNDDDDDDTSLSLMVPRNNASQRPHTEVVGNAAFEEDWIDRIHFGLPEWSSPSHDEFGLSPEYYESRNAVDVALQVGFEALIERDPDVATICTDLLRSDDGTIVVDSHPTYENSANVQDSGGKCTALVGHYASTHQGTEGVLTEDGEATTFTYRHFLATARSVRPSYNLGDLAYTDDLAPVKFPFENAKGKPFSAMRDVFTKFTVEEWIAVVTSRCQHYYYFFIDKMVLGYKIFKFVFYGKGKYLRPLYLEAFRRAKDYVCANCHHLATLLKEVELETMDVPHWCCIRHPQTPSTRKTMDDGVTFLFDSNEPPCTYFQKSKFPLILAHIHLI
jgi:hypothetical protein